MSRLLESILGPRVLDEPLFFWTLFTLSNNYNSETTQYTKQLVDKVFLFDLVMFFS